MNSLTQAFGILLTVIGAVGMILFFIPVPAAGIINIGNVTGFCVSAAFFFCGLFHEQIRLFLVTAWSRGGFPVHAVLIIAGAVITGIAVTALLLTLMMIGSACKKPAADADVIVLGCEVKGEIPSRMLTRRMDTAIIWLRKHPDVRCVLSGGKGETELISEAECMYRYMTARGIAPERLLKEDRSETTRENILFSVKLLEEKDGSTPAELVIVTNEFHLARAILIAEKLGVRAGAAAAPSAPWLFPTFYVRELYGLLFQILTQGGGVNKG